MENFLFNGSQLDFDYVLDKNGYKVSKDHETYIVFSKKIEIKNKHSGDFKLIDSCIEVSRARILPKNGRYNISSPYRITFIFSAFPLHAIRRLQWDTFPGDIPDVLNAMLKVAEAEAKICAFNFMETDIQIMRKFNENNENKAQDNS